MLYPCRKCIVRPTPRRVGFPSGLIGTERRARREDRMHMQHLVTAVRRRMPIVALMAAALALAPFAHAADAQIQDAALQPVEAMGKTLSGPQFSFKIRTIREYTNASGQPLTIFHGGNILVRRPDRFRADITGDDGRVSVAYDGKELALLGVEQNKYVTLAFAGDIEGTLQVAEQRLGFEFPLADFLVREPHKAFLSGVASGTKVNEVSIGGVTCDHLLFMQPPGIEVQLWVETGPRP